jgi:DNA modification methylase
MHLSPRSLKPYSGNARTHSAKQIRALEASIRRFGYTQPALISQHGEIIAGHGRVEAAKRLGLLTIPVIQINHLSDVDRRAYILADNQLALKAGWDKETLATELQHLVEVGFDLEIVGFEAPEVDLLLEVADETRRDPNIEDVSPDAMPDRPAVTQRGDKWLLGSKGPHQHELICGDSRDGNTIASLMGRDRATLLLSDPPYNVRIKNISGKGRAQHKEFAMASGEMKEEEFIAFLREFLSDSIPVLKTEGLIYLFMDWRHLFELQTAARLLDLALINLCVWNKSNGGMGSLYRSKHELVLIFGQGNRHRNNVELGKNGRNRTNVWDYAGVNTFRSQRGSELAMHPTVKPVAMIADAVRDVTKQGDIVLDPFSGSGTTIIAAEKTGRIARAVEIDPHYCDVAVRRWEIFTGKTAVLAGTNETFEAITERRHKPATRKQARQLYLLAAHEGKRS